MKELFELASSEALSDAAKRVRGAVGRYQHATGRADHRREADAYKAAYDAYREVYMTLDRTAGEKIALVYPGTDANARRARRSALVEFNKAMDEISHIPRLGTTTRLTIEGEPEELEDEIPRTQLMSPGRERATKQSMVPTDAELTELIEDLLRYPRREPSPAEPAAGPAAGPVAQPGGSGFYYGGALDDDPMGGMGEAGGPSESEWVDPQALAPGMAAADDVGQLQAAQASADYSLAQPDDLAEIDAQADADAWRMRADPVARADDWFDFEDADDVDDNGDFADARRGVSALLAPRGEAPTPAPAPPPARVPPPVKVRAPGGVSALPAGPSAPGEDTSGVLEQDMEFFEGSGFGSGLYGGALDGLDDLGSLLAHQTGASPASAAAAVADYLAHHPISFSLLMRFAQTLGAAKKTLLQRALSLGSGLRTGFTGGQTFDPREAMGRPEKRPAWLDDPRQLRPGYAAQEAAKRKWGDLPGSGSGFSFSGGALDEALDEKDDAGMAELHSELVAHCERAARQCRHDTDRVALVEGMGGSLTRLSGGRMDRHTATASALELAALDRLGEGVPFEDVRSCFDCT